MCLIYTSYFSLLHTDLNCVTDWGSQNYLSFNASKCCLLLLSNRSHFLISTDNQLNAEVIHSLEQCKDLGVISFQTICHGLITMPLPPTLMMIRRTFLVSTSVNIRKQLHNSYKQLYKSIQCHATKYILIEYESDYEYWLTALM